MSNVVDTMRNIYGSFEDEEGVELYQHALNCNKNEYVVELGCLLGRSTSVLAIAQKEKEFNLITIDPFVEGTSYTSKGNGTKEQFIRNMEKIQAVYTLYEDYSNNVVKKFENVVSLLFIDGDHSTKGVKSDCDLWLPKIKKGGKILFHDYKSSWLEVEINVSRLIREKVLRLDKVIKSMAVTTKL